MPFILHARNQCCSNCGNTETHSFLYEAEAIDVHGCAKKLRPATSIGPVDPVHVLQLPNTRVPICFRCVGQRAEIGAEVYSRWQETLRRKDEQRRAPPVANGNSGPRIPTLEELA